jgi:hypothetical protein
LRTDGNVARNAAFNLNRPKRGGVTSSPKYAERQSVWKKMLDSPINVDGKFKRFGACTRDELKQCVAARTEQIAMINNQISHIETIIGLLDQYGCATADELPEQTEL